MPESGSGESAISGEIEDGAPPAPILSERLLGARDLALAALQEITPAASIGPAAGYLPEADGVISLRFENRLAGYPGWYWTVTVAQVGDEEPTVLEAELLPGAGALLAPDWVPWAERLADYRAHQAELAIEAESDSAGEDGAEAEDDEEIADLDADGLDDEEDEDDLAPRLHAGDLDGVDIDELDDSAEDELDDSAEDEFDGSADDELDGSADDADDDDPESDDDDPESDDDDPESDAE